jgi:hypothetical protein
MLLYEGWYTFDTYPREESRRALLPQFKDNSFGRYLSDPERFGLGWSDEDVAFVNGASNRPFYRSHEISLYDVAAEDTCIPSRHGVIVGVLWTLSPKKGVREWSAFLRLLGQ